MVRLRDASSLAMLLVGDSGFPALAETVDVQAGQEIASQNCARCHAIGPVLEMLALGPVFTLPDEVGAPLDFRSVIVVHVVHYVCPNLELTLRMLASLDVSGGCLLHRS